MVTTSPAFTEAMYLLGRFTGWPGQRVLWRQVESGNLDVVDSRSIFARAKVLMEKYADRPMDLSDATLVALAERDGHKRIFTLDSDFGIYRMSNRKALRIIPSRV